MSFFNVSNTSILVLLLMNVILLYELTKLSDNCTHEHPVVIKNSAKLDHVIESRDIGDSKTTINVEGSKADLPVILLWHRPFNQDIQYKADPLICGHNIHCKITYNRDEAKHAGAIVFHYAAVSVLDMPVERDPNQLYVWWTGERHQKVFNRYDKLFNMTFTYRRDSDIYAPYGSTLLILEEIAKRSETDLTKLLNKKQSDKVAVWAVSNCSYKRRMILAQELEDHGIKIDKFGSCFDEKLELGKAFYDRISTYKFYLAFENAYHCRDYITEKFWFNGLMAGAVPVVFGAKKSDYENVAPTKSFIHVDDFENTEKLAKYLLYLNSNTSAYAEYLEWRNWVNHPEQIEPKIKNESKKLKSFCSLCNEIIRNEQVVKNGGILKQRIVPSLSTFWRLSENSECVQFRKSSPIRYHPHNSN